MFRIVVFLLLPMYIIIIIYIFQTLENLMNNRFIEKHISSIKTLKYVYGKRYYVPTISFILIIMKTINCLCC